MQLIKTVLFLTDIYKDSKPGYRSRYSDWLRDGRPSGPSPGGDKNSHFSMLSRPAMGPTQPPTQWVP
jgi:hypothetical protein